MYRAHAPECPQQLYCRVLKKTRVYTLQVFVFAPDKKLKLSILYPATTGRNFDEILRVVDSLQLTASKPVATPVDWKNGDSVMVLPNLPEEEAKQCFPKGVFTKELPSGKKYLRYTPQP